LIHLPNFCTGINNIGKNHGWAAENAILQCYALINRNIVLDFTVVAYSNIWSDDHILADVALFADTGTREDVRKMPNL